MASYAKLTIIGNLGGDPEMQSAPDGTPLTSFAVAVNERRRPSGDEQAQEHVQWFRVFCHGRQAEAAQQSLAKGAAVYVEGPLHVREFTTREGQKRLSLEVTAREMRVLSAPTPAPVSDER